MKKPNICIVIGILCIIGLFLAPRFHILETKVRLLSIQSLQSNISSISSIVHAQALVSGQTNATGSITFEGRTVKLVYGYPATSIGGIDAAINPATNGFSYAKGVFNFTPTAVPNCIVKYAQPAGANMAPTITATTKGC